MLKCWKGEESLVSSLHEFSPKWSPQVLALDRGGRCIVQRCDMTFTQCSVRKGVGPTFQTGAASAFCVLSPFNRMDDLFV